eukprot:3303605-Amphidinium_carterae.1
MKCRETSSCAVFLAQTCWALVFGFIVAPLGLAWVRTWVTKDSRAVSLFWHRFCSLRGGR